MTKVPQGFDFSFLNDEEARKILQVLERNEELQRAEKDRISKLQKTKRDIRWLQGVTGEWFEEIQRKKFCNETDVSQMLKQPLTYRLRKGMAENDPLELHTSGCKAVPPPRNFSSSFASLFSFSKSRRDTRPPGQKGCDGHAGLPGSVRATAMQSKLYSSSLGSQAVDGAFVPNPAGMREGNSVRLCDASGLENEFFRVLDDLDSKLAQEQSPNFMDTRTPFNYGSRPQSSQFFSRGNRHGDTTGRHKNHCNETSHMSIYDILRPGTPREGFKTFSPRTRTIYDMYRTREPRVLKEDSLQRNTFGSTSLCFDGRQRLASPATGHFTARSVQFPATTQNKSGFVPPSYQRSPKRIPLSSIMWNRADSSRQRPNQEEFLGTPSPMETDPADQYMSPRCFQENRIYEFYRSQAVHQSLNSPVDSIMHPDPFENSENVPFYHQDNPFARSFFSNTFGRSREQRVRQNPFGGRQQEYSSWSGFHQTRKPFISSNEDFEMMSTEVNSASPGQGHSVSSQHWGSFLSSHKVSIFRDREEPRPWLFGSRTSTLESMEVSQAIGNHAPHFGSPNICSMLGSSYDLKSGELECQQGDSKEVHLNKEPFSFGMAQTQASSARPSFPQIPDDKGNHQGPNFQNPMVTLQKLEPTSLPIRSHTEVTVTSSTSVDSPPLTLSQPNISVAEVNKEKGMNESILEKDKQLTKIDQTNTSETRHSETVISNPFADFQSPPSQDSAKTNRFVYNASTTTGLQKAPRVTSRKDISKTHIAQRDEATELKEDQSYTEHRNLGPVTSSSPLTQANRTPPSFPSSIQACCQELTVSNEDISSTIENNHWNSEPTGNPDAQPPEKTAILNTQEEQCSKSHSTNCSKSAAGRNTSCGSFGLSAGTPSNLLFRRVPVVPSSTVSPGKSLSGKDPSLEKRGKKDNHSKQQNNQFTSSPSGNEKHDDRCVSVLNEVVDVKCRSPPPFGAGKGKGKVRRRVSYIEKFSKTESKSTPTSSLVEASQSDSPAPEFHTACTLPSKAASFLINSRRSESKVVAPSFRKEPLPLQIENNVEDLVGKDTSHEFSPYSSESESRCSEAVSDSASGAPEATERMTTMGSPYIRKGPLPLFLIRRAVSCPSGIPDASRARDEREKRLVSDVGGAAVMPSSREKTVNPPESVSSVRDCFLTKRRHQKEHFQECTEKDSETAASKTGVFSLSNEDPLLFPSDVSGGKSGRTLHKLKTTSMFSVSGDEENVKCFEEVSIYYTLPRKHSKTFCNLLQKYAENIDSLPESAKGGIETFPSALEKRKLTSTPKQSETSSSGLKVMVRSAQDDSSRLFPHTENVTRWHLPSSGPSELTLQDRTSVVADVSLHKGESKTREISPGNLAKTPPGDSRSRKKRGKKLQSETLLQEKTGTEEKSENCQHSIKSANSGPSNPLAHSEETTGDPPTRRRAGECAGSGAGTATGSGECPQKDITIRANEDSSRGLQPRRVRGALSDKALSDAESQVFALTPALHQLHLGEGTRSGEQDFGSLPTEPRELPERRQEVSLTKKSKAKDKMERVTWDRLSLPVGTCKNETSLEDLEKGKSRPSAKHRMAAMSKASRKCPVKELSPKRHVATIFPQSGNSFGVNGLSLGTPECNPLSSEPAPKSRGRTDKNRGKNDGADVTGSENPRQVTVLSNREAPIYTGSQQSNNISRPHQNRFKNTAESPPKYEKSKDVPVAQTSERRSGALVPPTLTGQGEADFSDSQTRLNLHFPSGSAWKSAISIPLASCQKPQRSAASPEWEPEPHPYRSKSLKSVNTHSDLLRKSQPPKARERHFSENTSLDNALSCLTLGNDFSNSGYSRKLKSFSEFSSPGENESWAVYSGGTRAGPKSATSISRPIDYGIFGKEQQLAFLDNVKRSLTQGRLWKPSFLKNPVFLKDDVIHTPDPVASRSSNPGNQMPEDDLRLNVPFNVYEEDPVDSDCDTDTTTDDEYYLDENDKESEL